MRIKLWISVSLLQGLQKLLSQENWIRLFSICQSRFDPPQRAWPLVPAIAASGRRKRLNESQFLGLHLPGRHQPPDAGHPNPIADRRCGTALAYDGARLDHHCQLQSSPLDGLGAACRQCNSCRCQSIRIRYQLKYPAVADQDSGAALLPLRIAFLSE